METSPEFLHQKISNRSFRNKDLTGANFTNSQIMNCDFSNANLTGANFTNSQIIGCNFNEANLTETNFSNTITGRSFKQNSSICIRAFLTALAIVFFSPFVLLEHLFIILLSILASPLLSASIYLLLSLWFCYKAKDLKFADDSSASAAFVSGFLGLCMAILLFLMYAFDRKSITFLETMRGSSPLQLVLGTTLLSIGVICFFIAGTIICLNATGTSFWGADLRNVNFTKALLQNCDFTRANLVDINWRGARFLRCKGRNNKYEIEIKIKSNGS